MTNYNEGDVIEYAQFGGGKVMVKVDEKTPDVKNGRPGFAGDVVVRNAQGGLSFAKYANGERQGAWGYDSQVVRVVKKNS